MCTHSCCGRRPWFTVVIFFSGLLFNNMSSRRSFRTITKHHSSTDFHTHHSSTHPFTELLKRQLRFMLAVYPRYALRHLHRHRPPSQRGQAHGEEDVYRTGHTMNRSRCSTSIRRMRSNARGVSQDVSIPAIVMLTAADPKRDGCRTACRAGRTRTKSSTTRRRRDGFRERLWNLVHYR